MKRSRQPDAFSFAYQLCPPSRTSPVSALSCVSGHKSNARKRCVPVSFTWTCLAWITWATTSWSTRDVVRVFSNFSRATCHLERSAANFHQDMHCSGQFACTKCPASFSLKHQLLSHSLLHTDEKGFKCITYGKKYKCKSDLNAHTKSHAEASFQCPTCDYKAVSRNKLGYHMRCHEKASLKCHVSQLCIN